MSQIRLFFNPLDARSEQRFDVPRGTQLIDFLTENYPAGFGGVLVVFVGTERLELEDLDIEIGDEVVTMLVMPADPVTTYIAANWAALLIQTAVSMTIGLVIGLLFGPESPKGLKGEESPTYSINPTRNRARLGDPIAAHYGTVSYPPDYAAAPYVFFAEESNDMFVDELLCLGQGEFTLDSIFIGETPASAIEPGAVQYWMYGPQDHGEQIGTIQADVSSKVALSSTPYDFYEDVFTSPEVESFEFSGDVNDVISAPVALVGDAYAATVDPGTGQWNLGRITGFPDTLDIGAGDVITLVGSTSNNGDLVAGSVVNNGDGTLTVFESWANQGQIVDEQPLNAATTFTLNTTVNQMIAGPYRAQKLGQMINQVTCDIMFPAGIMDIDADGDQNYKVIDLVFTFQQIDESTGDPIGGAVIVNKQYRAKTRTAVRSTVSSGALTPGAYEVTVERTTPFATAGRDQETTLWVGLKGHVQPDTSQRAYGPVTLMALRLKATNALGSAARARVRVTATRTLPGGDSSNPITAFKDIWTNLDYGMQRDLDELDELSLANLEVAYAAPGGPRFNGSFDQKGTGWDALSAVVALAGARVVQQSALTTVVPDQVQTVRRAMFSTANIVPDSLEIIYTFDPAGDFDGVIVEYRDPTTFDPLYTTYPTTAVNPEKFTLVGCTDTTYATEYATYLWNVKTLRRKVVSFETELEGLIPVFGDRIGISHSMPDWGQSGVIVERLSDVLFRVDQALDWDRGSWMVLRDARGIPTELIPVTMGATQDLVVFPTVPPIVVFSPEGREPTSYSFGTTYTVMRDFIVSSIDPQSETSILVQGQVYDENIYNGGPPQMGGA